MAKMTIKGLDEYAAKLQKLSGGEADKIMKRAVYEGAGRMADKIRAAIQALPSFEPSWQGYKKPIRGVSDTQTVSYTHLLTILIFCAYAGEGRSLI